MYANEHLIDKTVEITVAKMANCALDGKGVANFMQEVYNKLVELNKNNQLYLALADISSARACIIFASSACAHLPADILLETYSITLSADSLISVCFSSFIVSLSFVT